MNLFFRLVKLHLRFVWAGLLCTKAFAQQEPVKPAVQVIAQAAGDSISLRWAPNSTLTWQTGNKHGYMVEKYLLLKDGQALDKAVRQTIARTSPFKPQPLESWEPLVKSNKYGAIAAQAIYGSTFSVQDRTAPNALSVIQRVQEMDNRFAFSLMAADYAWPVAVFSGLAFTDKDVRNGEKYLYKVRSYAAIVRKGLG